MEETDIKTGKFGWTYGLIGGLIGIAFTLMLYFMDMLTSSAQNIGVGIIGLLIWVAVMVTAIIAYKKANGGYITISKGLKIGAAVGLVCGLIGLVFSYVLYTYVTPETAAALAEIGKEATLKAYPQMTEEQVEQSLSFSTTIQYAASIIFPIIIGLIVGAITGAIVQNKRPE